MSGEKARAPHLARVVFLSMGGLTFVITTAMWLGMATFVVRDQRADERERAASMARFVAQSAVREGAWIGAESLQSIVDQLSQIHGAFRFVEVVRDGAVLARKFRERVPQPIPKGPPTEVYGTVIEVRDDLQGDEVYDVLAPIPGFDAHVRLGLKRGSLANQSRETLRNTTAASALALLLGLVLSWTVARAVTSEAERAQRELRESEERYRLLFEQAPDSIMLMGLDTPQRPLIIDANQATATMHGYTLDEVLGMSIADLDAPGERSKVEGRARRIMAGEVVVFETEHMRKDGSCFPVEVIARLVEIKGKPSIQAIDRDISERRRAESEKQVLEGQLQQAQKMEAIGSMAAGLAHEIKNPLAGIQGSIELLRDEAEGEARDLYELMIAELRRVNETIHSLLSFARPSKAKLADTDVAELLEDTVRLLRPGFSKKNISLEVSVDEGAAMFMLDRLQIRQVVLNLVSNAANAIESDGAIRLHACELPAPGGLRIDVQDDGPGVPEEEREAVFEPFHTTRFYGTGLGLAVARRLVDQHGGRLELSSEVGEGSTFSIVLPRGAGAETGEQKGVS